MKSIYILFLLSIYLLTSCNTEHSKNNSIILKQSRLFSPDTNISLNAELPSSIYTELSENKIIANPFESCNEEKIKWPEDLNWIYEFKFNLSNEELLSKIIKLNLKYIDTYAKLLINGKEKKITPNSFIKQSFYVKEFLKEGENIIQIKLLPIYKIEKSKMERYKNSFPGGSRVFTRKAQFQYGWDWAPSLNDRGIYGNIKLEFINKAQIENVNISTIEINKNSAKLKFNISIESTVNEQYKFVINNAEFDININKGKNQIIRILDIDNPKLWWPHNYGKQNLYNFNLRLKSNSSIVSTYSVNYGIRKSELNQDRLEKGSKFAFKINDTEIFMKGANIIPAHHFISKATDSMYISLVKQAKAANMNMLRVWGGGYYLPEAFYTECDKVGIAVWQDFMFAGGIYPESVFSKEEIKQQIQRLNNHPSVVLWCGNNEISEGWQNWGWTDNLSKYDSIKMYENYKFIFQKSIPELVAEFSPQTPYWESSPSLGRANPDYIYSGDAHNWWVWHDDSIFANYENQIPRFMSEFGFQSFPHLETLKDFSANDEYPDKYELECHQKHHSGFERIKSAMKRNLPMPKTIEDSVYLSQVLQAIGIEKGIRAQRTNAYCKGSLFWQLNDCWPVISWSAIDFNGYWKALMYRSKKAFDETILRTEIQGDSIIIYAANEADEYKDAELIVDIKNFKGEGGLKKARLIDLPKNFQGRIGSYYLGDFGHIDWTNHYIHASLNTGNRCLVDFFLKNKLKDIKLKPNTLEYKILNENMIEITATSLNLYVAIINSDNILEDNYFHMEAGEKRAVKIKDFENSEVISLNKYY